MTASRNSLRSLGLMAGAMACVASMGTGCGDARSDEVFIRFFHGYPGSPSISIFSSQGALVRDLEFNAYSDVVAIDRGLFDGQFTVLADGVPVTGLIPGEEIFSMYNGETATIMLTSRTQQQFSSLFLRHNVLTPGTGGVFGLDNFDCALEVHNGLAVQNSAQQNFSFSVQRRATADEIATVYDPQVDNTIVTECGPISLLDAAFPEFNDVRYPNGQAIANRRAEFRDEVSADPWLWPVENDTEEQTIDRLGGLLYIAGVWLKQGTLSAIRPSVDFQECMSGAIVIAQDDAAAAMGGGQESPCEFGPAGPTVPIENGKYKLEVDLAAIDLCVRGLADYTLVTFDPSVGTATASNTIYSFTSNARPTCAAQYRIRTAAQDYIFDPRDEFNTPGSGEKVTLQFEAPSSTYQYLVVYGLPLNPLVQFFNATDDGNSQDFFNDSRYPPNGTLYPDASSRVSGGGN